MKYNNSILKRIDLITNSFILLRTLYIYCSHEAWIKLIMSFAEKGYI